MYIAALDDGFEGLMCRDPVGFYKHGRSTEKEGGLMKLKPWHDAEAVIISMEEQLHNANPEKKNEIGYMKRSQSKVNLRAAGLMGKLICKSAKFGEFKVGTGFTEIQRENIFNTWPAAQGKTITFRYRGITKYGAPRAASFVRFRNSL